MGCSENKLHNRVTGLLL